MIQLNERGDLEVPPGYDDPSPTVLITAEELAEAGLAVVPVRVCEALLDDTPFPLRSARDELRAMLQARGQ